MDTGSKVLWAEGLFLPPQQSQQQDRFHEHRLHERVKALHPYAWGVASLQLDRDALASNTLRVLHMSLIFEDGELFAAPGNDELPDPVDLGALEPGPVVTFYAALPALKQCGGNVIPDRQVDNGARFVQNSPGMHDLQIEAEPAEVSYRKKRLCLISETEPRDGCVNFPLVRLRRLSTGGCEIDPAFVAPSLSIGSAPLLLLQLRRLMDALQAKVSALRNEPGKNVIDDRAGEMPTFWLLHTASGAVAALNHFFQHPALHPERLYERLLELAGALMAFSKNDVLAGLPAYEHAEPGPSFAQLHAIIRGLLDTAIQSRCGN